MKKSLLILVLLFSAGSVSAKKSAGGKNKYPKEAIIQSIIDLEQLKSYLHPEIPGRIPLVISDHLVGQNLTLNKFGKKVRIVAEEAATGAFLRFTVFNCKNGNYCNVAFEYPIEGLSGDTGVFVNRDGSLKFEKTEITESRNSK